MIVFTSESADIIYKHAVDKYPYECCGVLLGKREADGCRVVEDVYKADNGVQDEAGKNHFRIQTESVLYAEFIAVKKNYEIVGFYHSHVDCEAVASSEDSYYAIPDISYPIVSVTKGQINQFLSWRKNRIGEYEAMVMENIEIRD